MYSKEQVTHIKLTEENVFHFIFSVCDNNYNVTFTMTLFLNFDSVIHHTSVFYKHPLV